VVDPSTEARNNRGGIAELIIRTLALRRVASLFLACSEKRYQYK